MSVTASSLTVAGVRVTHPERVLFDELGLTKGALAEYYEAVADHLLPDLKGRPLSLVRCPQGPDEGCFFQKHIDAAWSGEIERVSIAQSDGEGIYAVANTAAAVVGLVQKGVIELHVWGSTTRDLAKPDRMVFDLDPDEGLDFNKVKEAAVRVRDLVAELGLKSFPLLTGGKGIHVVIPLDQTADWAEVKSFADRFSRAIAEAEPDRFTANIRKVQRKGRIFLDWLRNQRGATAVMPYSARAREGAPVAAPIAWDELDDYDSGAAFSIRDADELLKRAKSKRLAGWGEAKQSLPDA